MSRRLIHRSWVKTDLAKAERWYRRQRRGLDKEFRAEVKARFADVAKLPLSFAVKYRKDIRTALVRRFPYEICFVVTDDAIIILGVLHGHSDLAKHLSRRR
jgi:toxin ParE1/3/4